jgi:hypothetical protein
MLRMEMIFKAALALQRLTKPPRLAAHFWLRAGVSILPERRVVLDIQELLTVQHLTLVNVVSTSTAPTSCGTYRDPRICAARVADKWRDGHHPVDAIDAIRQI